MDTLKLIFGGILLAFGRKVFWLFVGVLGYETGFYLLQNTWHAPHGLSVFAGIALGFLAALAAIFLEKIAIGIAGFLAGAYLAIALTAHLHLEQSGFAWALTLVGGLIGAALLLGVFEWTLIFLTAIIGAGMIAANLGFSNFLTVVVFLILALVGVAFQGKFLRKK